jgi:hypothetical protein
LLILFGIRRNCQIGGKNLIPEPEPYTDKILWNILYSRLSPYVKKIIGDDFAFVRYWVRNITMRQYIGHS